MRRGDFTLLAGMLAVSCLLTAMPASAKPQVDWKTYQLSEPSIWAPNACAFTPDSHSVAVLYKSVRWLSEKGYEGVYATHLAVWDFKTGKVEEKRKWEFTSYGRGDPRPFQPKYVKYTADGRSLVIVDVGAIRVLDAATYAEVKNVAFEPPIGLGIVRHLGPGFSLTPDGSRLAVAFSSHGEGGAVRVYDLRRGELVREWRLHDEVRYITGVTLSSDGERTAISFSPFPFMRSSTPEAFIPPGIDNVRVMDVKTGETVFGVNTKYVAGQVLFGPNETLLTASINNDRTGYSLDTVKIWDARTGELLREITNPRAGVHYRLEFSADGKLLLGYTGTEKPDENFVFTDFQQFRIWDFASGKEVVASPEILPITNVVPQFQLSPDEKFVLVWEENGFANPLVYEIPEH